MIRCQWCDREATETIVLEPPRIDKKTGNALSFAVTADVCAQHRNVRDREGGKPIPDMRRRKAEGVKQVTIFDLLGGDPHTGPRDAIRGDDAA